MIPRGARRLPAYAAALLAVALLAFAVVRSTVMQAEAATPWGAAPICSAGEAGGPGADPRQSALASCSFCMAAAHSPLQAVAQPFAAPVCVRWLSFAQVQTSVLRQPDAIAPRARGPPDAG